MKTRTKTVEVIATRDEHGGMALWPKSTKLEYRNYGVHEREWYGWKVAPLMETESAKAMIGGTFCGIRKGGMKRLRVTIKVEEVA